MKLIRITLFIISVIVLCVYSPNVDFVLAEEKSTRPLILISDPNIRPVSLAVPPLIEKDLKSKGMGESLARVMRDDLTFSGLFTIMDDFPEDATDADFIKLAYWKSKGAEALIWGTISLEGEDIIVELRLFDVPLGKELTAKRYIASTDDQRRVGHIFSNEVVKMFTGDKGIFATNIAFVSLNPETYSKEIYIMDYDGFDPRIITDNGSLNLSPSWTPDGRSILFTTYLRGNPDTYLIKLDKGKAVPLSVYPGLNYGSKISPDFTKMAIVLTKDLNPEIYIMDLKTKRLSRLTHNPAIDVSPSWEPDGNQIAFISDRSGTPQVYIMDIYKKTSRRLTYLTVQNDYPAWSPGGDLIAFSGRERNGTFQIHLISPDAEYHTKVTESSSNCEFPSWSPDGKYLLYASDEDGKGNLNLNITRIFSEYTQRIKTQVPVYGWPVWSPYIEVGSEK